MPRRKPLLCLAVIALLGCEPRLSVGEWRCAAAPESGAAGENAPVVVPWSTSFENRFCDYTEVAGFCYLGEPARYETVTSPVHSGGRAAAFTVLAGDESGYQARCVRQGVLPEAAYYGAWYYVPSLAENSALWNLVHFQGGDSAGQHGLWDVSLVNGPDGELQLVVYDFLNQVVRHPASPAAVPIGAWFHIEFYLARAADATGQVALYQDGELALEATGIVTDDTNWGQWYVGNLATGLSPAEFTLYVDDVSIRADR